MNGPATAPARLASNMTERQFADRVAALARMYGWRVAHFRPARTAHGWRTPVGYDGAGYPDLVLVHPKRGLVWYRELKVGRRQLEPEQVLWRGWLVDAGANYDVWRPADWPDIVAALSNGKAWLHEAAGLTAPARPTTAHGLAGAAILADDAALGVLGVLGVLAVVVLVVLAFRYPVDPVERMSPRDMRRLEQRLRLERLEHPERES